MSEVAIKIENLGKRYRYGGQTPVSFNLRQDVMNWSKSLFRRNSSAAENDHFWALRDINLEIKQGEVVGIIGRNGAGKSTLLKILSRITPPTTGKITYHGRVASLLEVGTGFHRELTGRENIFLNGSILGMRRAEIGKKLDEIVRFAEVEKFIDTPVKFYSSGMYVRLAFAVAAHLDPDILLVDEVLAVGDTEFQRKCLGKMGEVASGGRTILFISHNMSAVQSLCGKVLYLKAGKIQSIGNPAAEIGAYLTDLRSTREAPSTTGLGTDLVLTRLDFTPSPIVCGEPAEFTLEITTKDKVQIRDLVLLIYSWQGARVSILDLRDSSESYQVEAFATLRIVGAIKSFCLVEGDYRIGLFVAYKDCQRDFLDLRQVEVASNTGHGDPPSYTPEHRGYVDLDYHVQHADRS